MPDSDPRGAVELVDALARDVTREDDRFGDRHGNANATRTGRSCGVKDIAAFDRFERLYPMVQLYPWLLFWFILLQNFILLATWQVLDFARLDCAVSAHFHAIDAIHGGGAPGASIRTSFTP